MEMIIENKIQYNAVLQEIENLMDSGPEPDSPDGKKLQLLAIQAKYYETELEVLQLPDPIEAIKFRMEQQDLSQRDLIPYIGSRSKVSEVLSKKRPLSLEMIRALNKKLGIPFKVLIQESHTEINESQLDWDNFPVKEIVTRNWLNNGNGDNYKKIDNKKIVSSFLNQLPTLPQFAALYRSNHNYRSGREMDKYSLYLWNVRILIKANSIKNNNIFDLGQLTKNELTNLVKLSRYDDGPLKAIEYLNGLGINVVVEPHMPRTYLDGAVILKENENPVIGLTIRYDRVDNFWFTLMHELAHIYLHSTKNIEVFYDDLDVNDKVNQFEMEADEFAREILVPKNEWINSPASQIKFPEAAEQLAKKLEIHPAIVAGKMRYEFNTYRLLNNLIGNKQVRKLFNDIEW